MLKHKRYNTFASCFHSNYNRSMLHIKRTIFLLSIVTITFLSGCRFLKKDNPLKNNTGDGYYSVKEFLDDQWHLLSDQPIVLLRVAKFNGKADSSFVPLDSTLWKNIRKQFDPTDISDPRFLNQYNFTSYSDNALSLIYVNYEANNKNLLTRTFNISADNLNHKIRSVFIETHSGNRTYEKSQKLTYVPHRLIQIQSFEKSIISRPEDMLITYYFKY